MGLILVRRPGEKIYRQGVGAVQAFASEALLGAAEAAMAESRCHSQQRGATDLRCKTDRLRNGPVRRRGRYYFAGAVSVDLSPQTALRSSAHDNIFGRFCDGSKGFPFGA